MNEIPLLPLIRAFMEKPMSGPEIEARSMEIIDREAPPHPFPPQSLPAQSGTQQVPCVQTAEGSEHSPHDPPHPSFPHSRLPHAGSHEG